ncbi:ATP-binding cassette domain-containing protein [Saccharothrix texasensis]|uniref:Nickel import system ATP-binding protein NikD n=1 Tax=Saccharothrix texasensis TaxID=103734 RepID=A0A3N1HJP3_9PSEU|nr:ATP-binding cassette domain-containing protein [Saccharothrix texasensis]ROP42719.1 peptide/nickel transport system ATP-binding protein [Saccharothrix texasensis]
MTTAPATPLLDIRSLAVSFTQYERGLRRRTVTALSGMDLTTDRGELVALVGASGAGKSLLAHAVLGMLPPNAAESGTVRFDGVVLDPPARRDRAGHDIALLPQSVTFLDPVTPVGRQVRRSAELAGRTSPDVVARAALDGRGLGPEVHRQYPHQLSGGQVRRVLTAMALMGDPALVIADEPTPGLPPEAVRAALADLRRIADQDRAVVLITHDLAAALEVADRVVICRHGRTVDEARPADFRADDLTHPYTRALWHALPGNGFRLLENA